MSQKQFTLEEKLKYIKLNEQFGLAFASKTFADEYWQQRYKSKGKTKLIIYRYGWILIRNWTKLYNIDIMLLKSKTGKSKKNNSSKSKKMTLNDLGENERNAYQWIVEKIFEDHGIKKSEILKRLKEYQEKDFKSINIKQMSDIFGFSRSLFYNNYQKKTKKDPTEKYLDKKLMNWILNEAQKSGEVIGRDKLYHKYLSTKRKKVSSYVFWINYLKTGYKSKAYTNKKTNKIPKEDKFKKVWTEDLIAGDFSSSYFGEKLHADIKFVKVDNKWKYLHVITETFSNSVLSWTLSDDRTAQSTINLLKSTLDKYGFSPRIFHSDHGIEYANYELKEFLESHSIKQSMSPKGNSLANRPSEYLFSIFQRELFDFYNTSEMTFSKVYNLINNFVSWYNSERPQSNLEYKTPYAINKHIALCV
ncbi:DDE-type integrase/transposase/recombinase [Mycoplasma nasistruthionis]|nr:DDE-type integrase/transposase/recombinase [Mycoplasma nasistruthionis]